MSDRNNILNTLKEEIQEDLQSGSYAIGVNEVKRGTYLWKDIVNFPAICFSCYRDEVINEFGGSGIRMLHIFFYGYAKSDGYGNPDNIHNLARDLEYFLYNEYSLTDDTEVGDITIMEGGINRNQNLFTLEVTIKYEFTLSTI